MSFAMLPPEINSGRMYAGPGAGPLTQAAEAWDNLAAELYSTAQDFGSVVSGLAGSSWLGPAAANMATAAEPHVRWLSTTAAHAEQAGTQAKMAASAYTQAFAMTVPPPVIATNRTEYLQLVATNIFGQNSPAIGANEAQYAEYWAQDGEAMDNYAAHSTAATQKLATQQFTPMAQTSDGGLAQTAAATSAQTQAAFSSGQQVAPLLQQALSQISTSPQTAWQTFSDYLYSIPPLTLPPAISAPLNLIGESGGMLSSFVSLPGIIGSIWGSASGNFAMIGATIQASAASASAAAVEFPVGAPGDGAKATLAAGTATPAASADVGQASVVGGLSVPPGWVDTAPAIRLATAALPTTNFAAIPGAGLTGGMPLFSGAPLVTMAARGVGGPFPTKRQPAVPRGRRTARGAGSRSASKRRQAGTRGRRVAGDGMGEPK